MKFIQITVNNDGDIIALDSDGQVWAQCGAYVSGYWEKVSMERKES